MTTSVTFEALVERARALSAQGGRRILGIVGAPGGGKSTLAQALVHRLGPLACHVPMDGFHLADVELARLGRGDRKGAYDTFDAAGYVALLRRVKWATDEVVYAPQFRREIEEPVAGAIPVLPQTTLVVTEGNYLFLDRGPFAAVMGLLDDAWYLDTDEDARLEQLIRRHIAFGRDPAAARAWALGTDQRNADLVAATRHNADLIFSVDLGELVSAPSGHGLERVSVPDRPALDRRY